VADYAKTHMFESLMGTILANHKLT